MDRTQQIALVIEELLSRRAAGEQVGDEATLAAHPDLRPELDERLRALARVERARQQAEQPADEASVDPTLAPRRLGDFEILREIARGGMGIVYEARQISLKRKVAVKVLNSALGFTPEARLRFRREAEAAARLHHTNIVPVYATGEENGVPYYAMELIEGVSLDRVIRHLRSDGAPVQCSTTVDQPLAQEMPSSGPEHKGPYAEEKGSTPTPGQTSSVLGSGSVYFDTVARLLADVADGLEHAHQHRVIHRDIKPSNLLLSPDGKLSLNDFGLARVLDQPGMTISGEFVGSPLYMSPEQVTAGRITIDHRTDIYSLGATLYELLTLQPPFPGRHRDQILAQIVQKDPRRPRGLNPKIPIDLETICCKCLEKDPDQRYQTARELAEDLRRFVNRFAIAARRVGPIGRAVKWVRRRRSVAAALACTVVLGLGTTFFAYRAYVAEQRRVAAQQQSALDKAVATAMTGNPEETQAAIGDAERNGVSAGQVHMLRGQLAFHQDDFEKAVQELEMACDLMPESVAPRSLLASACFSKGEVNRCEELLTEVQALVPITPEDFVFKGYSLTLFDPARAVQVLDEGIRHHDSVIARALRAGARGIYASDTGDRKDAELAMSDVEVARGMLPDNPQVIAASVCAYLAAATAYEVVGQNQKKDAALQVAAADARNLDRFDTLPSAVYGQLVYYLYTGQDERLYEVSRNAFERGRTNDLVTFWYAWCLYARGECGLAAPLLDRIKIRGFPFEVVKAFCLAELPEGPSKVLEEYSRLAGRATTADDITSCQSLLLLLGRKSQAGDAIRQFRKQTHPAPVLWDKQLPDYLCGDVSEEELVKAVDGSRSRARLCGTHFFIALAKLADGDRREASTHLSKSVATRIGIGCLPSKALLARLEKDPNWPPWIPVKK